MQSRVKCWAEELSRKMLKGFWKKVAEQARKEKRPILVSAPMANVTDAAFRRMLAKYGKVSPRRKPASRNAGGLDVIWNEFVSCDGLCSAGREILMRDLLFDKSERPIVLQLFGGNPEHFYTCALLAQKLGFDGIDINMGCPDKGIMKQGGGAALIKNPQLAQEIIKATIRGAGNLPVSVKTRIGDNEIEIKKWLPHLLDMDLAAITIHGRTKKELSLVPAHWDVIADAVALRDASGKDTLILGNGDVASLADAREKYEKCGVDGVMIGRAMFGKPWFFNPRKKEMSLKESLELALEHTVLFEKIFKGEKHFDIMKKHYRSYISGFADAKAMRMNLMTVSNLSSAKKELKKLIAMA